MTDEKCEYKKSSMTPCVITDGAVCYAMDAHYNPICVGCERTQEQCGIPLPADWDEQVKAARKVSP